jgi:hypothetical protein
VHLSCPPSADRRRRIDGVWLVCSQIKIARPSGRQDSNLRPLVPQTSTQFSMRAEFDLEWFVENWLE